MALDGKFKKISIVFILILTLVVSGTYVPRTDEYAPGEEVKMYFEIWGLTLETDKSDIKQVLKVVGPSGEEKNG